MDIDAAAADETLTVPLHVRRVRATDLDRAAIAFEDLSWLGRAVAGPPGPPGTRRVAALLDLPILDGSATSSVQKAALVDVGPVGRAGDRVIVEIAWRSASFAPLFPVFAGRLVVSPTEVVLDGRYAPPFGTLGLLIDHAFLHLAARRTAGALVARLAAAF